MGFFDFITDAGKKLLGQGDDSQAIKNEIEGSFDSQVIEGLEVEVDGDTVKVKGDAKDSESAAKIALIAGNIAGISKVDTSELGNIKEEMTYVIQKGDSLWKVAETYYKNGAKYTDIVDANKEVIKDADKIYPGQTIVIPNFDPSVFN